MKKKMIAYCGIDCETCDAYIATITNDDALREKTAKYWSELNQCEITPEMINCEGCRTEGIKTFFCDELCEIKKCAVGKQYETCGDCATFETCEMLQGVFAMDEQNMTNLK